MFRNPANDYEQQEELWDFRLMQIPGLLCMGNQILTLAPVLIELDLLVLQPDYAWILNPSIPLEASSMVRLVGSRVPITQANQLVALAAAARPSATRPVNALLYFRGLAMVQAVAELEAVEALPRQNAANPRGGQRKFQFAANGVLPFCSGPPLQSKHKWFVFGFP